VLIVSPFAREILFFASTGFLASLAARHSIDFAPFADDGTICIAKRFGDRT
jgi:hypothetical protein